MGTSWNTLFGTELHADIDVDIDVFLDDHYVCSVAVFLDDHYAILCVAHSVNTVCHVPSTPFVDHRNTDDS